MSRSALPNRSDPASGPAAPPEPVEADRRLARRRIGADAVLAGTILPVVGFAVVDLLNPGWSPVERMVSYYVHAPRGGWLISVCGVILAAASGGLLRMAATRTRGGRAGLWLLGVWCVGVLAAGLFPTDPYGHWDQPLSLAGALHGMGGLLAFTVLPVAAILLLRAWRPDSRWRPVRPALTGATVLTGLTFLVFAVVTVDVMADGPSMSIAGSQSVAGLAERVMVWSYALWLAVVAVGLRRMARSEAAGR